MEDTAKSREITWRELSKHNREGDAWLAVRGVVYDVTEWVHKHPGGKDVILLNAGKDATQLFEAYHPLKVKETLKKFEIGRLSAAEHPTFPEMSPFYIELKQKVENYFKENNIKPQDCGRLLPLSALFVAMVFVSHVLAVLSWPHSTFLALFFAAISGYATAMISLVPVHESSHASLTRYPWMWRIFGATHDVVNGASFYNWLHQHFLGHHPYTNLGDVDPDVHTNSPDIRRIKPNQPWYKYYTVQQFYAPLLYGLLALKFRISDVEMMYFSKSNGNIRMNPPGLWHSTMFVFGKLFWLFYRIFLPYAALTYTPYSSLYSSVSSTFLALVCLLFVSDLVTSWYLAFVFQVNHVVAPAVWPTVDKETGLVDMDWAELQITSTIDYAHDSALVTFMSGALNYQVVHHLFPYVSQVHYPAIAPIVRKACEERGIPYVVLPSFWTAFKAHIGYLAWMGRGEDRLRKGRGAAKKDGRSAKDRTKAKGK